MAVKILMVDGDAAILELARATISSVQWCELVTLEDGNDAAEILQKHKFDGIILADRIPRMDGFRLIQYVKHSHVNASIPIVMLTAEDEIETMRRGFNAGVTFFSSKPGSRERFYRLFNAVRGAMETERRRHHRLPYRTPVTCKLGDERHFVAESREISEGGMSVTPSGGVAVGQVVELEFLLPQLSRPIQTEARTVRKSMFAEPEMTVAGPQKVRATVRFAPSSGEIMGLDFLGLTPAQREAIQHYITGGS